MQNFGQHFCIEIIYKQRNPAEWDILWIELFSEMNWNLYKSRLVHCVSLRFIAADYKRFSQQLSEVLSRALKEEKTTPAKASGNYIFILKNPGF